MNMIWIRMRRFRRAWYLRHAEDALRRREIARTLRLLPYAFASAPIGTLRLLSFGAWRVFLRLPVIRSLADWCRRTFKVTPRFYHEVRECGVNRSPRRERVVVTLTSYPGRIGTIHKVLTTLLNQTFKPDVLVLWLASEQFPNGERDVPESVLRLKKFGLTIDWCTDIRSFKKLIPALRKYPNAFCITADDDVYYPPDWLAGLVATHEKYPRAVVCHRARRPRLDADGAFRPYLDWTGCVANWRPGVEMPIGIGGGGYPCGALHEDVFREDLFLSLCPFADDIWFWTMALVNGTRVKVVPHHISNFTPVYEVNNDESLSAVNMYGNRNDRQLAAVLSRYPQLADIVRENLK